MGWHTPDEYFERHVLPYKEYAEVKAMIDAEHAGQNQQVEASHSHGSFSRILESYGYEATLAFLDQARDRAAERAAARAAELAAKPPTVPLAERAVAVVMMLDEAWREMKRGRSENADSGPADVFLRAFDPSITFTEANLDLTDEVVSAIEQMKDELNQSGYFRDPNGDPHLLEDADTLISKMRSRLSA
jgi:hypothetical protein